MESGNKLLTLAQAAELSACSTKTLRRAIDAGELATVRLGQSAKSDRIHAVDLEAWWQRSRYVPRPCRSSRKRLSSSHSHHLLRSGLQNYWQRSEPSPLPRLRTMRRKTK